MTFDPQALLDLWSGPVGPESLEAFRRLYADPMSINGAALTPADLVRSARALQGALADVQREVLDVVDAGSKVALAFRLEGRHVGPLTTSGGVLAPTGERVSVRVIDILTLLDGKITEITMVAEQPVKAQPCR